MSTLPTPTVHCNGNSRGSPFEGLPSADDAARLFLDEDSEATAPEPQEATGAAPILTQTALTALAQLLEAGEPMTLSLHSGGVLAELRVRLVDEDEPAGRTRTEAAILSVLDTAGKPLKGAAIASRAGLRFNSHLSVTLSRMVKAGELVKVDGGYTLAPQEERPLPQSVQTILTVLKSTSRPLKGEAIARRAGKPRLDAGFSRRLAELVKSGEVVKVEGAGYWLASRNLELAGGEPQQGGPEQ